jgi:ankyrin repeat protein
MRREIQDERLKLESRNPPAPSDEVVDMLDSKLTNYISDLRKTDPHYEKKIRYFKGLLSSGMLPNAKNTFRRKGHTSQQPGGGRKTRRRKGGNPPKIVVSNPAWNLPKPGPKPQPKPNPGGRRKTQKNRRRRSGGGEAEQAELLDAVKRGNLEDTKAAISRGADVNTGVGMQAPPLTWAIHKNRLDLVKLLVESGADVNMQDRMGGVPIVHAGENRPEILGFLITHGARYPAGWPISARLRTIIEKQGAIEVGVKKDLPTPVPSIIKGFLGGADPTDRELFRAIQSRSVESVKEAFDNGADPNAVDPESENTPLIEAVHTDEPELVQLLIDAGAQVDTKGSEGGTALYWAADNMPLNDVKSPIAVKINTIIKILLKAGANPQVVYDTLAKYPAALEHAKKKIVRAQNQTMAIEVGVKKDLPPFLPGMIRGFLGARRR